MVQELIRPSLGSTHQRLDVRKLAALREVAWHGSIAKAAPAMRVTPAALSQQLTSLEHSAGAQLLVRSTRGATPTELGLRLIEHADAVFAELERAEAVIAERRNGEATLSIATFASVIGPIVAPALTSFPHHGIVELDPSDALPALARGSVDIAIVHGFDLDNVAAGLGCELTHLLDDPMRLVLPHDHDLAGDDAVDLALLADATWITPPIASACFRTILRACNGIGFEPRLGAEVSDWNATLALVAAGRGVALAPELVLDSARLDGVTTVVPQVPVARRIHVAHRSGSEHHRVVAPLLRELQRAAHDVDA